MEGAPTSNVWSEDDAHVRERQQRVLFSPNVAEAVYSKDGLELGTPTGSTGYPSHKLWETGADTTVAEVVKNLGQRLGQARAREHQHEVHDVVEQLLKLMQGKDPSAISVQLFAVPGAVDALAGLVVSDRGATGDMALMVLDIPAHTHPASRYAVCESTFLRLSVEALRLPPTRGNREARLRALALIGDLSSHCNRGRALVHATPGLFEALLGVISALNELQSTRESALSALVHITNSAEVAGAIRERERSRASEVTRSSSAPEFDRLLASVVSALPTSIMGTPRARLAAMDIVCNLFRVGGNVALDLSASLAVVQAMVKKVDGAPQMLIKAKEALTLYGQASGVDFMTMDASASMEYIADTPWGGQGQDDRLPQDAIQRVEQSLRVFYIVNCPKKLHKVPHILARFVSQGASARLLAQLNNDLRTTYGKSLTDYSNLSAGPNRDSDDPSAGSKTFCPASGPGPQHGGLSDSSAMHGLSGLDCSLECTSVGLYVITAIRPGGACERAGIEPGCVLEAINDVCTRGLSMSEIRALAGGPAGSTARLTINSIDAYDDEGRPLEPERSTADSAALSAHGDQSKVPVVDGSKLSRRASQLDDWHQAPKTPPPTAIYREPEFNVSSAVSKEIVGRDNTYHRDTPLYTTPTSAAFSFGMTPASPASVLTTSALQVESRKACMCVHTHSSQTKPSTLTHNYTNTHTLLQAENVASLSSDAAPSTPALRHSGSTPTVPTAVPTVAAPALSQLDDPQPPLSRTLERKSGPLAFVHTESVSPPPPPPSPAKSTLLQATPNYSACSSYSYQENSESDVRSGPARAEREAGADQDEVEAMR